MGEPPHKQGAPPQYVHVDKKKAPKWRLWLLLALALVALLLLLSRCGRRETEVAPQTAPAAPAAPAAEAAAALPVEQVTLPGGQTVGLAPQTLNYELQRFLASDAPAPRTFTFDKLNFDTNAAVIRSVDQPTIQALAQILNAYPNARVQLIGFADARGSEAQNAQLASQRAAAVSQALVAAGVDPSRVSTASGGESKPVESNATSEGRFENRRTDLIVTSK
ncbi:OmpA family protein [Phenylobacterium deserti]|uniref:OmpA family protein n=1 Tax=Phenylobacterium deserti TaxID=1914756 RepID=UPI001401FFE7|nr:OmpA family protein [Phenylobacterium deserti]